MKVTLAVPYNGAGAGETVDLYTPDAKRLVELGRARFVGTPEEDPVAAAVAEKAAESAATATVATSTPVVPKPKPPVKKPSPEKQD